jgi:thioredoxin reductase
MTNTHGLSGVPSAPGAQRNVDVVVVGGGVAGLAAALTLVRALRSVVVIDAGQPRNAPAAHTHGYLTRDGARPLDLVTIGRDEIAGYGGQIFEGEATSLERLRAGGFRVVAGDVTSWNARRVLMATGLVDELPDVPGLRERWGRDVVHCVYCFGWELRDQPIGFLATGPQAVTQALLWRQWSSDLVVLLHTADDPTDEERNQLAASGIRLISGEVAAIEIADDLVTGVRLTSGELVERRAVALTPRLRARHHLLDGLGVALEERIPGMAWQVEADLTGRTATAGIWVAGNVGDVTAGVLQSAASGVTAAATINADLVAEDAARALAGRTLGPAS